MRILLQAAALAGLLCGWSAQAPAQTPDFYRGKDVRILIGAGPGGSYGLYGQLATRHMRQHIPGEPTLIIQHMPGAGGLIGLNYSYAVAPKDGTLMHLVHSEILFETLLNKDVRFNAAHYRWIGRFADADSLLFVTAASGAQSMDIARAREITMGATGIANIYALAPLMLNRTAGTKFKIIGGYKGVADIVLAMERGEVDGAGMSLANALSQHAEKLTSGSWQPLLAIAAHRLSDYPQVPAFTEFATGTERTLLEIYASNGTIGRALAFPPGVSDERLQIMRNAFARTLADPAFQAEVRKAGIPLSPMSGDELTQEVSRLMSTPASEVEAARRMHESLLQQR